MANRKQSAAASGSSKPDEQPTRKRGRPVGSKNSVKTTRPDSTVNPLPGDNTRFINHDMRLMALPDIDMNDHEAVKSRINEYFRICAEDDIKPSVASFALAFSINRMTLFNWLTGKVKYIANSKSLDTLQKAYDSINSYYEHMMNNGKINPVAGIFLMKNNLGYKDTTDYVITPNTDNNTSLPDIVNRAGLLEE